MGKLITVPFAALLRGMYKLTGSYGLSIMLFAIIVKAILLPFQMKSKRSMVRMGRLSGKQAELQKMYGNNQQKYQEELTKLYQEEGVNPMGGCLWSLLPLFIMLPLYSIIYRPITHFMGLSEDVLSTLTTAAEGLGFALSGAQQGYAQLFLTDFISKNWSQFEGMVDGLINVDFTFLGLNLGVTPTSQFKSFMLDWEHIGVLLIPFLSAGLQMVSSKLMAKSNGQSSEQQGQMRMMNLMMPLMSLYFCFIMPSAMGVYWIINSVLMTVQEVLLGKFYTKKLNAEEDEREAKREATRKLRMEEAKKRAAEQKESADQDEKRVKKQPEKKVSTNTAGRIEERPYARGRSYQEDRYENKE